MAPYVVVESYLTLCTYLVFKLNFYIHLFVTAKHKESWIDSLYCYSYIYTKVLVLSLSDYSFGVDGVDGDSWHTTLRRD